jgi:hypothetical protein
MSKTTLATLFLLLINLFGATAPAVAQSPEDEVIGRVETRTVSVSLLVSDRGNRRPVTDLQPDDVQIFVDGKRRPTDYFGFRGNVRKPLTLLLCANLAADSAGRQLIAPETMPSLKAALETLNDRDRVGVMVLDDLFAGHPEILVQPTRNWDEVLNTFAAALARPHRLDLKTRRREQIPVEQAIAYAREIAGKDDSTETVLVMISDGINTLDTFSKRHRSELADRLLDGGIGLSAVNFDPLPGYAAAAAVLNPIGFAFGLSVTGSANVLAEKTGGISIKAGEAGGLGPALARVLEAYSSRYDIGFPLEEQDEKNGKRHRIEVKITDQGRKNRKLTIRHRTWFTIGSQADTNP